MAKRVKEPSQREIMASIRKITPKERLAEEEFARQVLAIFREAEWSAAHTSGAGTMPGDLIATRAELGRERRYLIDVVIEINPPRLKRSYENFRHFVRSRKEPFSEFDEYWLVGQSFIGGPMRKNPNNDRHFRALDLKQLRELLAIPEPKKAGKGRATTRIGKAVEANEKEITLAISGLILQVDEKLEKLRDERPNSNEAKARAAEEISELEQMKAELKRIRELVAAFTKGKAPEKEIVKSVKTFRDDLQRWWDKRHDSLLTTTAKSALFVSSAGVLALMGANTPATLAVVGALIGGKVVKKIKKIGKKVLDAIQ